MKGFPNYPGMYFTDKENPVEVLMKDTIFKLHQKVNNVETNGRSVVLGF